MNTAEDFHHTLANGRVIFLRHPITDDERSEFSTPEANAILERITDRIDQRKNKDLGPRDAAYFAFLKEHKIEGIL